jgi:hypothetical protein
MERIKMVSEFNQRSGVVLTDNKQIFSRKGSNRLEWLVSQTPRSSHWVFPGGTVTINLFEAASYCFVNGQFLGAMVMGLSYIEHTLVSLFTAAGRKDLENAGVEVLAREATSLGLLKQNDFDIIKEATKKRNAKFVMQKTIGPQNDENPTIIDENEQDSTVYEEDGRKIMSVVIQLLDKKML